MEWLFEMLLYQGLSFEAAKELVERKRKQPSLTGVSVNGRWVALAAPSTDKFNDMVESGTPPGVSGTDRAFLQGKQSAKVYKPSLARFPNDPRAFVSDLGQAQQVIHLRQEEEKRKEGPAPDVDVSDKIVDRETHLELARDREATAEFKVTGREYRDAREKTKNRLRPSWKKKS